MPQGTWSYDENETEARDQVRGWIGDVNSTDQLISNEVLDSLLTANGDVVLLTARAAIKRIMAAFARVDIDSRFGPSSISASQRRANFLQTLATIETEISTGASPFAGGISKVSKEGYEQDTDRVEPSFTREMFDYPGDNTLSQLTELNS